MKRCILLCIGIVLFAHFSSDTAVSAGLFQTPGTTYTVNTTDDADDGACDAAHCSLREAINAANASAGTDLIAFPASAVIMPLSALPAITDPVVIDGAPQAGGAIVLSGELASDASVGLHIIAGGSAVRGLTLYDWWNASILLENGGGNLVEDNVVGLNTDGFATGTATTGGVWLRNSSDNTIRLNLLSGNGTGLIIEATASGLAARNVVQGNLIGTDPTGNQARPNWGHGVRILGGSDNLIGGPSLGFDTNIISGNGDTGVLIEARTSSSPPVLPTGNRVVGNFIGPDMSGRRLIPGQTYGVMLRDGSGNSIGGANPGEGNVIAGAGTMFHGVLLYRATANVVQGNRIGTTVDGSAALSACGGCYTNNGVFIHDSTDNRIIGNVIAGGKNGIALFGSGAAWPNEPYRAATGNIIQGNHIGVNASGAPLPNEQHGIVLMNHTSNNLIGGTNPAEVNVIAHNGATGVLIDQLSGEPPSEEPGRGNGNTILGNSIYSNGGLGIDLDGNTSPAYGDESGDGVTANDAGDADSGLNDLQNAPVLVAAATDGSTTAVNGRIESTPDTAFSIAFYASAACDPSGYGEGERYLGAANVTTDGVGRADIAASLSAVPPGTIITATATNPAGSTSEFSDCETVGQPSSSTQPLLLNPSFEQRDAASWRLPAFWAASWNGGRSWRTCQQAHSGSCALIMWTSGNYAWVQQTVNETGSAGDTISLAVWARGSNLQTSNYLRVRIYLYNLGTISQTRTIPIPAGTYDWRLLQIQFAASQPFTQIRVAFQTSGTSGTAWFDDVALIHEP